MKTKILMLIILTALFAYSTNAQTKQSSTKPDKFDAVVAAPNNHKIVYEDDNVRILQVICPPGNEEPVHTHQYKSTMWFTQSAHFIYYNYLINTNNQLIKKDSTEIKGFPAEVLNKGQMVDPEGLHSVKNVGTDIFMAYRIEYKKDFKQQQAAKDSKVKTKHQ